jgi:hypothetical protein
MPIDPGEHEIVASAPGFIDPRSKVAIAGEGTVVPHALPALEKQPEAPVVVEPPRVHEGRLVIKSQPDAHILLDASEVGVGAYDGKVKSGGHQLRVTAPGMRPYQSEVFVADDEARTIDVPLEKESAATVMYVPRGVEEDKGPSFELGLGFAPGVKGHGDSPAVLSYRADVGLRLGRRVDLGVFIEYASISTSGSCGTSIPGPMLASPYDYGTHNQFKGCHYFTPGLQLYVHILPKRRVDPYVGVAPGFRFGFVDLQPYQNGMPLLQPNSTQMLPGIGFDSRVGVDFHPSPKMPGWVIGPFLDLHTMVIAQENVDNQSGDKNATYLSFFGGVRSALAF